MNSFIETLCLEDGQLRNLRLHQIRMAATIRELHGNLAPLPSLGEALSPHITHAHSHGLFKCRVTYDTRILGIDIHPYTPRPINSLKIVQAPAQLDYHLKSTDRTQLTSLAAEKGECDEVIIVRNGLITDTSFTNLLFSSTRFGLLTPLTPLLRGTMRQHLLDSGLITPADMTPSDLLPSNPLSITHVILINALLPLSRAPLLPLSAIHF